MKTSAKFIVFHPSLHKPGGGGGGGPTVASHRAWLVVFVLFFIFTFAFTLFSSRDTGSAAKIAANAAARAKSQLPRPVFDALLHYASENITSLAGRMSFDEVKSVAAALRRCAAPCNFLVFGLTHETLLWNSLNHNGRTVFVDESSYLITKLEEKPAARSVRRAVRDEDCKLAINDMPNHIYDVAWDVILIDGPRGYSSTTPGRMAAIFTAGVLARSKRGGAAETHVFVHEIEREVERVCSDEFLCGENLVETTESLGHFVIGKMESHRNRFGFCSVSGSSVSPEST
ncbi:UNVERIFIED_CONTAM: protein IRREGULAR XYLEM 15 [Sesamum radiatum]|uniref:Protein IRREGULAR XYLEM 15 n=1 Tax=Sesamum radiatum TaxID=300843 RepID=A0AAW2RVM6_SESRA